MVTASQNRGQKEEICCKQSDCGVVLLIAVTTFQLESQKMKLYLNDKKRLLGKTAVRRIETRALAAFDRFRNDVRSIIITVESVNTARGEIEKVCKVLVKLRNRQEFFVTDKNASMSKVVASAIERIGRSVGRKLSRKYDRSRTRLQLEA